MKIKICGITRFEDAQLSAEHGVDAIGFIFYEKNIPLMITSQSKLDLLTSSMNLKQFFKRTISRLYELTSIKYSYL